MFSLSEWISARVLAAVETTLAQDPATNADREGTDKDVLSTHVLASQTLIWLLSEYLDLLRS